MNDLCYRSTYDRLFLVFFFSPGTQKQWHPVRLDSARDSHKVGNTSSVVMVSSAIPYSGAGACGRVQLFLLVLPTLTALITMKML